MYCRKCNTPIPEGGLICPYCHDKFALDEQREHLEKAQNQSFSIMEKSFRSPIFIIVSVLMTLFALSNFAILLLQLFDNVVVALSAVLPLIFSIISAVYYWITVASKNSYNLHYNIRKFSMYEAYMRVILIISTIIYGLAAIALIVLLIMSVYSSKGLIADADAEEAIKSASIAIIVALLLVMVCMIWCCIVFAKRRKYFLFLSSAAYSQKYSHYIKAPQISSYIYSGIVTVSALVSIFGSVLLYDFAISLAETFAGEEAVDMISDAVPLTSILLSFVNQLIFGAYLVLSTVFMTYLTKKEKKNGIIIAEAERKYNEIQEATKAESLRMYKEEQEKANAARAEKEARAVEEERFVRLEECRIKETERQRAQVEKDNAYMTQQMAQQMTQQMMQQMMMQQMMSMTEKTVSARQEQKPAQQTGNAVPGNTMIASKSAVPQPEPKPEPQSEPEQKEQNAQFTPEQLQQIMAQLVNSGLINPQSVNASTAASEQEPAEAPEEAVKICETPVDIAEPAPVDSIQPEPVEEIPAPEVAPKMPEQIYEAQQVTEPQPQQAQQPQQPMYAQPMYGQPMYAPQPQQSMYGQPMYAPQPQQQPMYGQPMYAPQQQPMYSQPMYASQQQQPTYAPAEPPAEPQQEPAKKESIFNKFKRK